MSQEFKLRTGVDVEVDVREGPDYGTDGVPMVKFVHLHLDDHEADAAVWVNATSEEARQIAQALIRAAEEADPTVSAPA